MAAHTSSRGAYFAVFAALMVLLVVTVAVAHVHLGHWAPIVALAIAAVKIVLIAAVFMHLRDDPPIVRLFASAGLFWLGILFVLGASDYLTRNTVIPAEPTTNAPGPADNAPASRPEAH